tara:strand:+ start:775 stop:1383 length:609 start_codon:yes stop_codon:yes gene_type:complete
MARQASLIINGTIFSGGLLKLDRKKIYGWSKIDIFDEDDKPCKLASIYDGRYVLPSGSTSLLCFNKNGDYISKSSLVGVDNKGVKVEKVESIFKEPPILSKSNLDDYLSINVKSVYQLEMTVNKDELLKILSNSEIYHFYFNYRADYDADDAFLITNGQEIFIVVGKKADLDFIGLENKEEELPDDPDEEEIDNDEFDFSML